MIERRDKDGRPRADETIDMKQVAIFGRFRATHETMADFFGISTRTIERYMAEVDGKFCRHYKKGMSKLKMKLSEAQIEAACNGNATMLVWLGKQYLDQKDKQEVSSTVEFTGQPVITFGNTSKGEE